MNQTPDTQPGPYYVSIIKDSGDYRLLSGPYDDHQTALDMVEPARRIADKYDPRAHWYAFGTARLKDPADAIPGVLQKLGYDLALKEIVK